jgi:hypothetical protein
MQNPNNTNFIDNSSNNSRGTDPLGRLIREEERKSRPIKVENPENPNPALPSSNTNSDRQSYANFLGQPSALGVQAQGSVSAQGEGQARGNSSSNSTRQLTKVRYR